MAEHVDRFVQELTPAARAIGAEYGIDPALIITQAAIESGWGKEVAGNNYFGVKSHGQPGGQSVLTHEEVNGQLVPMYQDFRQYDSLEESMRDYAKFLKDNPRYSGVFEASDLQGQIDAVAGSGYATSSKYPGLLNDVSRMVTRAMPPATGGSAMAYAPTPAPRSQNPALGGIMRAVLPNIGPTGGPSLQPAVMRPAKQGFWGAMTGGLLGGGQTPAAPIMRTAANVAAMPQNIMRSGANPALSLAARTAVMDPMIQRVFSNGSRPAPGAMAAAQQAVAQSGDTSTGNQADAAAVRASAQAWRDSRR